MRRRRRHRRRSATRFADRRRESSPWAYFRITAWKVAGAGDADVAPEGVNEMKSPSCTSFGMPAAEGASLAPEPAAPTGMLRVPMFEPPLIATAIAAGAVVMVP